MTLADFSWNPVDWITGAADDVAHAVANLATGLFDLANHVIASAVCWIQTGATLTVNGIVLQIANAAAYVTGHLPNMPDVPTFPSELFGAPVVAYLNYIFPVGFFAAALVTAGGTWLVIQGVAIVLRWAKVI